MKSTRCSRTTLRNLYAATCKKGDNDLSHQLSCCLTDCLRCLHEAVLELPPVETRQRIPAEPSITNTSTTITPPARCVESFASTAMVVSVSSGQRGASARRYRLPRSRRRAHVSRT